jgi:hypothetical protein
MLSVSMQSLMARREVICHGLGIGSEICHDYVMAKSVTVYKKANCHFLHVSDLYSMTYSIVYKLEI